MTIKIPHYFQQKMRTIYGAEGAAWLRQLPGLLAHYAQKWQLTFEQPVDNLSYNFVVHARRGETAVVFKIGYPNREIFTEMAALRAYDGRGAVRLLAADEANAAFLLESIIPGTELSTLADDEAATRIVADVIRRLQRPAPSQHTFPHLHDWAEVFTRLSTTLGDACPIPRPLLNKAAGYFAELTVPAADEMLLHGDLHHFNILQAGVESWVAIDPKGVIGDPAFETARFLHNPYPDILTRTDVVPRRVDIICEALGMDRQRVAAWGFCDAVLSAAWSVEDNDDDFLDEMLAFAQMMVQHYGL